VDIDEELNLVALADRFNAFLDETRARTHSLFLAAYREGTRKRISFDLVYRILSHILDD
jgi:hypothetical protein